MTRDQRIAFLERGINSELTPEHVRLQMQETLAVLLAPEPPPYVPPAPVKRAPRPRVKRKPEPVPAKAELPPPPPPRELTVEEMESRTEELRARRAKAIARAE